MIHALLKLYILERLKNVGEISGDTVDILLRKFSLTGVVSKTKFQSALGSLEYKDKKIHILRPSEDQMGISDQPFRSYVIKLAKPWR